MIAAEAKLFLIALQFLTRIPVGPIRDLPQDWLVRSVKCMPLVGALIGVVAGGVLLVSAAFFPEPLPVVIGLAMAIALTGAMHEDGLADTVDAMGGGADRERTLEIMKDSRIGTFGALALVVVLALKGTALAQMDPHSAFRVLIAGHAGARLAAVLMLSALPYAGAGNAMVSRTTSRMTPGEIVTAIALGLTPGLIVLQPAILFIPTMFALGATGLTALVARRRIGGYTGDVLGAVEQVYETTFFMFAAAMISGPG
jgi:adenosylcobinamide-GDP ribazoletransferase